MTTRADLIALAEKAEEDETQVTEPMLRDVFYAITQPGGIGWSLWLCYWWTLRDAVKQRDDFVNHQLAPEKVIGDRDAKKAGQHAYDYALDQCDLAIDEAAGNLLNEKKVA